MGCRIESSIISDTVHDGTEALTPALWFAVEEQLGLRLAKRTAPIEVLVVDHVAKIPRIDLPPRGMSFQRSGVPFGKKVLA